MKEYWTKINEKFIVVELVEKLEDDCKADWEVEGYCLTEIPDKFLETIERDYENNIIADRKFWTLKNLNH